MKEKGITLIALIVTIIVLIILAGITIATFTGNNGLLNNANNAKEETEIANEKEIVDRATINAMGNNKRGNIVKDELQDELDRITKVGDTEVKIIRKKLIVEFTTSHRMYQVDNDGNVFEYVYTDLPIMEAGSDFNNRMADYREKILTVTVLDNINIPENTYQIFDVSKEQDETVKAWLIESEENPEMYNLCIGGMDGVDIEDCDSMFSHFSNCITIDLENLYTGKVKSFLAMFAYCFKLININLGNMDTGNAITMTQLFFNCSSIEEIDLANFNTDNVTDMRMMFANCSKLKNLDVSCLNTTSVKNMYLMFSGCSSLPSINVSNWNTSKVINMQRMFCYCTFSNIDVSNWDTSNVADMSYMFISCTKLEKLDLSNWDANNVTNIQHMFDNCVKLMTIYTSEKWGNNSQVTIGSGVFLNCKNLRGAIVYDANKTDVNYANYNTGYFTYKT